MFHKFVYSTKMYGDVFKLTYDFDHHEAIDHFTFHDLAFLTLVLNGVLLD